MTGLFIRKNDDLKTRALKIKDYKNKYIKNFLTNHFNGQAGNAVFRNTALLTKAQVNQNWLLQILLAPEHKHYI